MAKRVTYERLKCLLHYNPSTGILTWVSRSSTASRVTIGGVAGTINNYGYVMIKIDDISYKAHRLAWLYMTGKWPSRLDHEDTNKSNNRWNNLRLANRSQNGANVGLSKANKTGFKGVCFIPRLRKFKAQITTDGSVVYLGLFDDPQLAHEAYKIAAIEYHGEFARFS